MEYLILYLCVINFLGFLFYGLDKRRAIIKKWRLKESFLFFISFIGGALGCFFGMYVFRHKTLKIKFYVVNILALSIWIYILMELVF